MKRLSLLVILLIPCFAFSDEKPATIQNEVITEIQEQKKSVTELELKSREVMGRIYQINAKMRNMSRKRDILMNKMLAAESSVKGVARNIAEYEKILAKQRKNLAGRLKAIYILGDEGVVRVLFSSASAQDLDQTIKYLKIISQRDFDLIEEYLQTLNKLKEQKEKLNREVKKLLIAQKAYRHQEMLLDQDHNEKSNILSFINHKRQESIMNLEKIRRSLGVKEFNDEINLSFYEKRGKLIAPVSAQILKPYGILEDEEFKYKINHKGYTFKTSKLESIRNIFKGTVEFAGEIPGYGKCVIINHGDHYYTVYASLEVLKVASGQTVEANRSIALSKDNMYFEIRHFSDPIDPKNWLAEI